MTEYGIQYDEDYEELGQVMVTVIFSAKNDDRARRSFERRCKAILKNSKKKDAPIVVRPIRLFRLSKNHKEGTLIATQE